MIRLTDCTVYQFFLDNHISIVTDTLERVIVADIFVSRLMWNPNVYTHCTVSAKKDGMYIAFNLGVTEKI